MTTEPPARDVMLEWIRNQDPYARLAHYIHEDGARHTALFVTAAGDELEFDGTDEMAVLLDGVNALRARHRLPPVSGPSRRDDLERQIVAASFAGDDAAVATLTRELVAHNTGTPLRPVRSNFRARTTWP